MYNLYVSKKDRKKEEKPFEVYDILAEDMDLYHSSESNVVTEAVRYDAFTVKDLPVSYRVINHWSDKGLLPNSFGKGENDWREFTLMEVFWVHIVVKLRKIGLPLKVIKKIKEQIMVYDSKLQRYKEFEYYVMRSMFTRSDVYLAVMMDGRAQLVDSFQIEYEKAFRGSRSMILISLKEIVNADMNLETFKPKIAIFLSLAEAEIVSLIRTGDKRKIELSVKKGDVSNAISEDALSGVLSKKDIESALKLSGGYADIVTKYENSIPQSTTVRNKKKY